MHLWCGIQLATSEVCIGNGVMTVSPPHPSWLQPHLKCLCPGSSTPARKPAVPENIRQGLHNVQNHERSCWCKPICRSAGAQVLQLQGAQIPTPCPSLQNRHVPAFVLPISNLTLELYPHRCSTSRDSTSLQNCTDRLDGRKCLTVIRISDFLTCF